jgi:hypothetical protein
MPASALPMSFIPSLFFFFSFPVIIDIFIPHYSKCYNIIYDNYDFKIMGIIRTVARDVILCFIRKHKYIYVTYFKYFP